MCNADSRQSDSLSATSRVQLVPLSETHVDFVLQWVNDPEVVKNFQNFDKILTREEELSIIRGMVESPYDHIFSIFEKETGTYIGQGGINAVSPKNHLGRLSIFICKQAQGKGFGTEAVREILRVGFGSLELNKVWLMAYASNKKAIRLYKKLGFVIEGTLREEYYWNGAYHDITRMGLLQRDFTV